MAKSKPRCQSRGGLTVDCRAIHCSLRKFHREDHTFEVWYWPLNFRERVLSKIFAPRRKDKSK